ncbi:amino acid permease [Robertmurraya andreesenii]|uniref:L-asparagine transporter-like permease n=1 Tax=Anoxybacillus andreesenii TaxID=1325932 RepID=A0ABT9V296_9BACL|nr:amino acid permease [Robertmurraya andreesenii]MDQ0155041.1 L-asparagine transporter-like permease [Robertmurraya andreesenii]
MEIPARAADFGGTKDKENKDKLSWWQLSLIGVGCIIGTGYFLGSGLGIKMTGPSILISFLLAWLGTYIVSDALMKMAERDPQQGAFRSYAKKAYGDWAGFSSGWVYWFSEMLITGSQLTALSILSRFWFPDVPLWIFAVGYAILGVIVVIIGTKGFERAQNIFAVIKIAAILMFIILAVAVLFGLFGGSSKDFTIPNTMDKFFPKGMMGLWSSLIYGFYAFGGIEIMGIMAPRLRNREDTQKSGAIMLMMLVIVYLISLTFATGLVSVDQFSSDESPFKSALERYKIGFFPHVFNGGIIIAGFSTMTASLFAVTSMLVTLSKDGDAPRFFSRQGKWKVPPFALGLTICGLVTSIILSFAMPDSVYEYITTAAGLMLLYNWLFILISFPRLIEATGFDHVKRFTGMALILVAISGTLTHGSSRPGFFISILFVVLVLVVLFFMHLKKKRKHKNESTN